jgi:hypothetical protein
MPLKEKKMSKHTHHQDRTEKINNKTHDTTLLQQKKTVLNDNSVQLEAYLIHQEKGGSALDNWLEAELILKNGGNVN